MPTSIYRSAGMAIHTPDGNGIALPVRPEQTFGRWSTLIRPGTDRRIAVLNARVGGGGALAAFFGTAEDKVWLRDWFRSEGGASAAPGSLWGRRAEPRIQAALRYWPTWSCRGLEARDGRGENFNRERVTINPRGQLPLAAITGAGGGVYLDADGNEEPSPASAAFRIDLIRRPTIGATIAGHALPTLLDEEPDEGG